MRLRTFLTATKTAIQTFIEVLNGKEDAITPAPMATPTPTALLCEDEAVLGKAREVLRAITLNPAMRDDDTLRFAASGMNGVSVVPTSTYYGLDIDPWDHPTVIRWMIDPAKRTDVALFIPRRNTNALSSEQWTGNPKVALANDATAEEAITVLGWYLGRVRRGQIPATTDI